MNKKDKTFISKQFQQAKKYNYTTKNNKCNQ